MSWKQTSDLYGKARRRIFEKARPAAAEAFSDSLQQSEEKEVLRRGTVGAPVEVGKHAGQTN